jgi:hypothetical protein
MGNIEKPLTWVLIVVSLGLLFTENYQNLDLKFENGIYGISISENKVEMKDINPSEDMNLNIDSIVDAVLENIDMKIGADTVIKIIERE